FSFFPQRLSFPPCCSISESFLTVKGAALFLPRGNGSSLSSASRFSQLRSKHAGDLQQHLQTMFTLLRPEDNIKLAVRLESTLYQGTRYMVVVSTNGRQDTEESLVLGMDFSLTDSSCSVGLVLPLWSDTLIHLDGDGGFSVSTDNRIHVFKPVSVQAMWSALQSLHKACEVARCHNYFPGSLFLTWVSYYQSRVSSDQSRINEWNAMKDVQSHRADSPVLFSDVPTERERTERLIKTRLREIMMQKDLENVTCKEIRTELEEHMVCNLREFKEYIDNEMIVILGQMDSPTEIFDHVYLGSEWNASNLEELQNSGVQYILNVTREIDNFFPGLFEYHNIRVYDEEATDLLAYWNDTYKFISRAKKAGAKCLVHCKMGVSRSASTVIAYAMKEYGWDLGRAFDYVKERRAVTKPNPSFMRQLEEYQGILLASKQRHNKLWRSHSDSDLSEHHEPLCKPVHHTLGRSDLRNQGNSPNAPSLEELLQPLDAAPPAGSVCLPSPPLSNGQCNLEEDPSTPPLPRPQAATAVPGVSTVTAAETVPVERPHPPASPQHAPVAPAPPLPPSGTDRPPKAEEPSSHMPRHPQVAETSAPVPVRKHDCDSHLTGGAVDCSGAQQPPGDEGFGLQDPASSALSTDHINFFSAREKFQGLAQDGRTRCLSDQAVQHTPQLTPRAPGPEQQEDPSAETPVEGGEEEEKKRATSNPHPEATSNPHPEATSNPQNASLCSPGTGVKTVQEDGACSPMEEDGGQETGRGSSHTNSPVSAVHPTHIARQRLAVDHASSAGFLCLEGVTEQESSTDGGDPTGRHGHAVVVTETWETLRELGAFLCQVNRGGAKVSRRVGQAWGEVGAAGRSGAAGCNRERAREVEVRIRKAGLTPPSLMKRSASLAKLDCLELSANDLSYWELSPASPGTHSVESPTLATVEDCSKKLRMLSHNASCPNTCAVLTSVSDSLRTQGEGTVEGGHTCSERSPQSGQAWQGGASLDSGLALMPCLISVATRQQYERTHPLRRFKKRTVSTLYHTI
uniref:protein-serine/threonine phosphatase n=1 Tax=Esox lucius TaxID=8010 RepID=A0A3P8XLR6_ESOLU